MQLAETQSVCTTISNGLLLLLLARRAELVKALFSAGSLKLTVTFTCILEEQRESPEGSQPVKCTQELSSLPLRNKSLGIL